MEQRRPDQMIGGEYGTDVLTEKEGSLVTFR